MNGVFTADFRTPGQVHIDGFPTNVNVALALCADIQRAIIGFFLDAARDGRLDSMGNAQPKLIQPADNIAIGDLIHG